MTTFSNPEHQQEMAAQLCERLHHAPRLSETYSMFWTPNGGRNGDKKRSQWFARGEPLIIEADRQEQNWYFGVNPSAVCREVYQASTNKTIGATNALFGEFDGKDYVREDESKPHYVTPDLAALEAAVRQEAESEGLDEKQLQRRIKGRKRGALVRAHNEAIGAAFKLDPEEYKRRALTHILALAKQPSALWDSGGGYQGVWLLDKTEYIFRPDGSRDIQQYDRLASIQKRWVAHIDGDRSASDLRRIFRCPGSYNYKPKYAPDFPLVYFVSFDLTLAYRLDDLEALMVKPEQDEEPKRKPRQKVYVPPGLPPELGDFGDVPVLPYGHGTVAAYNEGTNLHDQLLKYGYTDHEVPERMSRPGGDSGGLELMPGNTACIYSTNDPLFSDGRIRITPAHVLCVYEFDGDVSAMLEALEREFAPAAESMRQLCALRTWAQSPVLVGLLRGHGITRPAEYAKTLIAIVNYAIKNNTQHVLVGYRLLGEMTNRSHMTAKRHLAILSSGLEEKQKDGTITNRPGLNLVTVSEDTKRRGTWVDLTHVLQTVTSLTGGAVEENEEPQDKHIPCNTCNSLQQFADDHLQSDAFIQYPHHFATKMRPTAEILPYGLNAAALLIAAVLSEHGELTRNAICQLTGLAPYTVGKMLRRMDSLELLVIRKDRSHRYELCPDFEQALDGVWPLLSSYGIGQRRAGQTMGARAAYVARKLNGHMPLSDKERARLLERRKEYDAAQQKYYAAAEVMGLDLSARLVERRQLPKGLSSNWRTFDHVEAWNNFYRKVYEEWNKLGLSRSSYRERKMAELGFSMDTIYTASGLARLMQFLRVADRKAMAV